MRMRNYLWIFALLGVWLVIAPFILEYSQAAPAALWNDLAVGVITLALALFGYSQKGE